MNESQRRRNPPATDDVPNNAAPLDNAPIADPLNDGSSRRPAAKRDHLAEELPPGDPPRCSSPREPNETLPKETPRKQASPKRTPPEETSPERSSPEDAREGPADGVRRTADWIVRELRRRGFEAYWAGGCVRDQLLGRTPKDYDVVTSARPDEIRHVFGFGRTKPIGAAFGVIAVYRPRTPGYVEVATFRSDFDYTDGRHPGRVEFGDARADAQRRDFTINGLFFDPIENRVIDFVGGQADLAARVIRAIGQPRQRFTEDKLRLLRAVRFAADLGFEIEADTWHALCAMATEIGVVSAERIAGELRRMLTEHDRVRAVELLDASGLAGELMPRWAAAPTDARTASVQTLARLEQPGFELALAALFAGLLGPKETASLGRRWKLSNKEIERTVWLVEHCRDLVDAERRPWSQVQPLLSAEGADDLIALTAAREPAAEAALDFCRARRSLPEAELNPPPLLTGNDLIAAGMKPGPQFAAIIAAIRAEQLDRRLHTRDEALQRAGRLARELADTNKPESV